MKFISELFVMLLYSHSCVAHILFTLYCRLNETIDNTKMRCILDTKIATEALVYSYLLYQFLYMAKMSLVVATNDLFALKNHHLGVITRHNPASHISAYTHGFAYICDCLSLSLFFNSEVDVS